MNYKKTGMIAVSLVLLAVLPILVGERPYVLRIFVLMLLLAAMGQAWNILGGLTGQISLGHAAFFGAGAYTSLLLYIDFGISPWLGLIAAIIVGGLLGVVFSIPTLGLKGHYFALSTLAAGEIMRIITISWVDLTGGPVGLTLPISKEPGLASMQFSSELGYYYLAAALCVVITLIFSVLRASSFGYGLRALRSSESAAEAIGINTRLYKLAATVISAGLMAACGVLFIQHEGFMDPDGAFSLMSVSVPAALVTILGGTGRAAGPLIGAVILVGAEQLTQSWLGAGVGGLAYVLFGLILLGVILLTPRGIIEFVVRNRPAR